MCIRLIRCSLPIPWLLYGIVFQAPVEVNSCGMVCSIAILFMMLLFVIASIACFQWRMNKGLGVTMFLLYFVFVAISLMFEYGHLTCPFWSVVVIKSKGESFQQASRISDCRSNSMHVNQNECEKQLYSIIMCNQNKTEDVCSRSSNSSRIIIIIIIVQHTYTFSMDWMYFSGNVNYQEILFTHKYDF